MQGRGKYRRRPQSLAELSASMDSLTTGLKDKYLKNHRRFAGLESPKGHNSSASSAAASVHSPRCAAKHEGGWSDAGNKPDNTHDRTQEEAVITGTGGLRSAVLRSDGTVISWYRPGKQVAVSVERRSRPRGANDEWRIFAAHATGEVALNFGFDGAGSINYPPPGNAGAPYLILAADGSGRVLSPAGDVEHDWGPSGNTNPLSMMRHSRRQQPSTAASRACLEAQLLVQKTGPSTSALRQTKSGCEDNVSVQRSATRDVKFGRRLGRHLGVRFTLRTRTLEVFLRHRGIHLRFVRGYNRERDCHLPAHCDLFGRRKPSPSPPSSPRDDGPLSTMTIAEAVANVTQATLEAANALRRIRTIPDC